GAGDPGRGYRRSRVARAEHLTKSDEAAWAGVASAHGAASSHCPFALITTRHGAASCGGCFDGRRLFKLNICVVFELRPKPDLPPPVHRNGVPPRSQPRPPSP